MPIVLIVEGEHAVRAAAASALRNAGLDVHEAEHGREALDRLEAGLRPDLILFDLMGPAMSGWEFRAAQLRDPDLSAIPVCVVVDAGLEAEVAERLAAAGALHRGCPAAHLVVTVRRILGLPLSDEDAA